MRQFIDIVTEAVRPAYLYHGTSVTSALEILKSDRISSGGYTISLSRNIDIGKKFADIKSEAAIEEWVNERASELSGDPDDAEIAAVIPVAVIEKWFADRSHEGGVIFVLDQTAIKHRYSVSPHNDDPHTHDGKWEYEERISRDIYPVKPLIVSILVTKDFPQISEAILNGFRGVEPQPQYASELAFIAEKSLLR